MGKPIFAFVLGSLIALAGCGGGGAAGEPLVSGSLTGEYRGQPFTPAFGFATLYNGGHIIGVGDGPLHCGSPEATDPPAGTNAIIAVPEMAAGSYSSVFVQLYHNVGSFSGTGSSMGNLTITSVTAESVAGSVQYDYTDDENRRYVLSGTFEVMRCPG